MHAPGIAVSTIGTSIASFLYCSVRKRLKGEHCSQVRNGQNSAAAQQRLTLYDFVKETCYVSQPWTDFSR